MSEPEPALQMPAVSAPLVLEYQRAEKAKRNATGGLMLMGIAVVGFATLFLVIFATSLRPRMSYVLEFLMVVAYTALPMAWGTTYILLSVLIRRGSRKACWVALVMTSIQALIWFNVTIFGTYALLTNRYDSWHLLLLLFVLLVAIAVGFGAIVVEVWRVLRAPQLWRVGN